jgi:hypothetical protein
MRFTETQKLNYLLSAIRREPTLEAAHVYLQAEMTRGTMTYALAMKDLHLRAETLRADEALADGGPRPHRTSTRGAYVSQVSDMGSPGTVAEGSSSVDAFVTTHNKRQNVKDTRTAKPDNRKAYTNATTGTVCLVAGCTDLCSLPICRLHFASLICGKVSNLTLRSNYGQVTYDKQTQRAVYPSTLPADLLIRRKSGMSSPKA